MSEVELYIYGCQSCGTNATHIRRLKRHCKESGKSLVIKNTKYDSNALTDQVGYLSANRMETDKYYAIVVEENRVTLLREWQP